MERAFSEYRAMPEGAEMDTADVCVLFGVSDPVVRRWKKQLGYLNDQERKFRDLEWRVTSHPDFGKEDHNAPVAAQVVADAIGCSKDFVCRMRRIYGVLPPAKANVKSYEKKRPPLPKAIVRIAKHLESWGRPEGIDEHLDTLPKRFSPCSG